jgi:hypothetical protein
MDIREEIKAIAKRLAAGEQISDEELKSFMSQARDYMMEHSEVVEQPKFGQSDRFIDPFGENLNTLPKHILHGSQRYFSFTTCSCGSRVDSCGSCESYDGSAMNTSMFALSEQGTTIRFLKIKDSERTT